MVDLTCNGQVSLFPNEPLTNEGFIYALRMIELSYGLQDFGWVYLLSIHPQVAQLPLLNKVFGIAYGYLKTIEQKRALQRGETLSDESFKYTWSWEQFLYDWIYAPNGKPFVDHGPSMSSLYSFWLQQFSGEGFYQVPLPPTCSFARWINDGVCSFDYSGFAELFGADITFRTTIKRCSDPGLPAIQLQCVGSACSALSRPLSCTSNPSCPRGMVCRALNGLQMQQFNFDALYLAAIAESNPTQIFNDTKNVPCAGSPYWSQDSVFFLDKFGQSTPGSPTVCQFNVTADWTRSEFWDNWVNKVYDGIQTLPNGLGRLLLLNYFKSWP